MPSKLGDFCKLVGGYAYSSDDFSSAGVPVIKIGDVTGGGRISYTSMQCVSREIANNTMRFKPEPGDTLIAMTGANVGRTARVRINDSEARINQRVGRFIPIAEAGYSKNYIHFLVSSPIAYSYFANTAYGSAQPNISSSLIEALPVPDIEPTEANRIGEFLCSLDDKIDLNRRMNETLEAMARAIFKDRFVDFGPTRAKAEGRAPYLAPELWALFPDRLDDDDKPEGWKNARLGDVARTVGESVKPNEMSPHTPYIGLEHMPRRSIALNTWEGAGKVTSGKLAFHRGDFLFGKLRPYFHKVGLAPLDGICSTDIVVLGPKNITYAAFVLCCISTDEFVAYTDQTSGGTKMPRTSWELMARYPLCLPSEAITEQFQYLVAPTLDRIILNTHETNTLANTRDLLLPKLMSGEIRLREAEKIVEAAA